MSSQEELLDTDLLRSRIMDLAYHEMTEEQIRQIYMEETGRSAPNYIKVYETDDYLADFSVENGFHGTSIHFYDESLGIHQTYTIAIVRTTMENHHLIPIDWTYHTFGIFDSRKIGQFEALKAFHHQVTNEIANQASTNDSLVKFGLGHAYGGNLISLLQLITKDFFHVYTLNSTPPTFYQHAYFDKTFWQSLAIHFQINKDHFPDIYQVDPIKLKMFAEAYYLESGQKITHVTTTHNLLTMFFHGEIRGFFRVGKHIEPLKTAVTNDRIAKLMIQIPDRAIKELQLWLADDLNVIREKGLVGVLEKRTGIDINC